MASSIRAVRSSDSGEADKRHSMLAGEATEEHGVGEQPMLQGDLPLLLLLGGIATAEVAALVNWLLHL
jgi:hypothetical protein